VRPVREATGRIERADDEAGRIEAIVLVSSRGGASGSAYTLIVETKPYNDVRGASAATDIVTTCGTNPHVSMTVSAALQRPDEMRPDEVEPPMRRTFTRARSDGRR